MNLRKFLVGFVLNYFSQGHRNPPKIKSIRFFKSSAINEENKMITPYTTSCSANISATMIREQLRERNRNYADHDEIKPPIFCGCFYDHCLAGCSRHTVKISVCVSVCVCVLSLQSLSKQPSQIA